MIFGGFMKGMSIRGFKFFLQHVGANVEIVNGFCFVQIWQVVFEKLRNTMSRGDS